MNHHRKIVRREISVLYIIQDPIFVNHKFLAYPDIVFSVFHFNILVQRGECAGCFISRLKDNCV
jgi:hypothetical protein